MSCTSREHEQNLILTGSCPACGEGVRQAPVDPAVSAVMDEMLQRCRRMETRVTNLLRAIGLSPGATIPDPSRGTALYRDGKVHVSSPEVTLADVAVAAVRGTKGNTSTVQIVLCNQPWGHIHVTGKE